MPSKKSKKESFYKPLNCTILVCFDLVLKCKTKDCKPDGNGKITITGYSKDKNFNGSVNNEFVKTVKEVVRATETAKLNVGSNITNNAGNDVLFDDFQQAVAEAKGVKNDITANFDFGDIQAVNKQAPELGLALVGHILKEGLEIMKPDNIGAIWYNAHNAGMDTERKILGQQDRRHDPYANDIGSLTHQFVYTTIQYDIDLKASKGPNIISNVKKITPPNVQRPKK
jgi:hypothetical protein